MKETFQNFRDKIPKLRVCPKCGARCTKYHEHFGKAPIKAIPKIKDGE